MTATLAPLDGALRVRLAEDTWSGLCRELGSGTGSLLRPLPTVRGDHPPEQDATLLDATLLEATGLALGPAPLHLDLVTARGDRGVLAVVGCDGRSAASAVRAVATPPGGEATPVPGVEVSGYPAQRLVAELLRLLPPDGVALPLSAEEPTEVSLPEPAAVALSRALQVGDERLARGIARQCGHDEVPDLLRAVTEQVRASATVTIAVAGSAVVQVHTWLQCRAGWVDVAVSAGSCTSRLVDRERIRLTLTHALTGGFDVLLDGDRDG